MLGTMLSGVMLARDIFGFLPFQANSFARALHMSATGWSFVLSACHIGQHWNMAVEKMRKHAILKFPVTVVMRCCVAGISTYGLYAFIDRVLGKNMFLTVQYAFFDFEEPLAGFLLDYATILMLYAAASYYLLKLLTMLGKKKTANSKGGQM